jgi:hypothetical protein
MGTRLFSLSLLAAALSLSPLLAQDAKHLSYRSSSRQSSDEVQDIGEISGTGAEVDGKTMPEAQELKGKFRFNVAARGEYTSNSKLTGNHTSSDFIGLPTIEGGYNVALGKYFTFDLSAKVESAIYAEYGDRGFLGYSANATLDYRPFTGAPRVYVTAEPYRYESFDTGDRMTQAIGLAAGTDWGKAFNNGRSLAFVGYNYESYLADPTIDSRNSHRVVVGLAHQLRQNLTGQIFYAWQFNDFTEIDRRDSRNMVGVSLTAAFTKHIFGSWTTSFVDNESDFIRASYQSVSSSLGLTVQF